MLGEYRIHNADVHLKQDYDVDELIDVIEGSRVYIPCIYAVNKIDQVLGLHGAGWGWGACAAVAGSACWAGASWRRREASLRAAPCSRRTRAHAPRNPCSYLPPCAPADHD